MISRADIKFLRSLEIKKFRHQYGLLLIEGFRMVRECLDAGYPIKRFFASDPFQMSESGRELGSRLEEFQIKTETVTNIALNQITKTRNAQGCAALIPIPETGNPLEFQSPVLILDQINDPGNLGTLLRTAEWFGVRHVVLSPGSVDPFNPKTVRAGMGAHFYLELSQTALEPVLDSYIERRFELIGGVLDGDPLTAVSDSGSRWALVLGSEARGISAPVAGRLTKRLTIPKRGHLESLNLTIAGSIMLAALTSGQG